MTLFGLLAAIVIVALILYILQIIPLESPVKLVFQIVVALLLVLWLLNGFGALNHKIW